MDNHNRSTRHIPFPASYWLTHAIPSFSKMLTNEETEVGVIGGGIAGVMTAYLLTKAGKQVTLVEARELLHGVTGHTTAKISAQHGLIYDDLIQTFDEETARLYYEASMVGRNLIFDTVQQLNIPCGLEERDAVVFATSEKSTKKIEAEARAYETLGIDGALKYGAVDELPFPVESTLTMHKQAQFHPVQFLSPLLDEIKQLGGRIYDHTRAVELSHDDRVIHMENGTQLNCEQIVVATHYPFNDFDGLYLSKLSISRSYALLSKINVAVPQAMYLSAESPSRSLRSLTDEMGEEWLLIGGDDHPTGKSDTMTQAHYRNLEAFGKTWFDLQEVAYRWSAQDMMTLDQVPYIGEMTKKTPDVYVATGFDKWGMAMGATAAQLMTDLILNQSNRFRDLFDPSRSKMKTTDLTEFLKKNVSVAKYFVATKTERPHLKTR